MINIPLFSCKSPFKLTCTVYIGEKLWLNEGSELIHNMKIEIPGFTQTLVKCNENEELRKKQLLCDFFTRRRYSNTKSKLIYLKEKCQLEGFLSGFVHAVIQYPKGRPPQSWLDMLFLHLEYRILVNIYI